MCEIFGICSRKPFTVNEYLRRFYKRSDKHPDGWGLSVMHRNVSLIEKEPEKAAISHYLAERLTVPIEVRSAFAHIRYATIGNLEYANCHPFTRQDAGGRRWTLIHNGTIFDYPELNRYFHFQQGSTDSERILMHVVALMDEEAEQQEVLDFDRRFALLDQMICKMARGNKLNLMIYDGEYMYVHTNCDCGLHYRKDPGRILISTAPLDPEGWEVHPTNVLVAYQNGVRKKTGTDHGHSFVMNEEEMKYIFQTFSNL